MEPLGKLASQPEFSKCHSSSGEQADPYFGELPSETAL